MKPATSFMFRRFVRQPAFCLMHSLTRQNTPAIDTETKAKHLQYTSNVATMILEAPRKDFKATLEKLDAYNRYWPFEMVGQKQLASSLHGLLHQKRYEEINLVADKLKSVNYEMWGGLATVILYAHCERRNWSQAICLFEDMKSKGQVKHNRLHKHLITSLAQHKEMSTAMKYLEELCTEKTTCATMNSMDVLMVKVLLSAVEDCSEKLSSLLGLYLKGKNITDLELAKRLVNYLQSGNTYLVRKTFLNKSICCSCKYDLITRCNFLSLCQQIISKRADDDNADYEVVDHLHGEHGVFDIVIDVANVFRHGKNPHYRNDSFRRFRAVLNSVNEEANSYRVALVLPPFFSKSINKPERDIIREISTERFSNLTLTLIEPRVVNDDLLALYIAARSEMQGHLMGIISNDSFLNHAQPLDEKASNEFIMFLRQRLRPFNKTGLVDFRRKIPSFSINEDGDVHVVHGANIWCARKECDN